MRSLLGTVFTALYAVIGLLLAGLAVPLIARRVPPNNVYGFRVPQTLNDPALWYRTNAFAGYLLLAAGVILALAALGLRLWFPDMSFSRYATICSLILLGLVLVSFLVSWLYLQSLIS